MKEFYIEYLKITVGEEDWKKFLIKYVIPERVIRTVNNIICKQGRITSSIIYSDKDSYLLNSTVLEIPMKYLKNSFVRKYKIRYILKD